MVCSIMAVSLIGAGGPRSAVGKSPALDSQRQTEDQCLVNYDWKYEIAYKANQSNPLAKPEQLKWNGPLSVRGLTLVRFNAFFFHEKTGIKRRSTQFAARYWSHFSQWDKTNRGPAGARQQVTARLLPWPVHEDQVLSYRSTRQAFQSRCLSNKFSLYTDCALCEDGGKKHQQTLM